MHAASLSVSWDLKIPLSLSMGTCSEPVCLTSMAVKWPQQAVSLSVSPAVSLSVSPAGRKDSSFPWAMYHLTRHNLIISQDTTKNSDGSKYPLLQVSILSLSTTHFFQMTNHSELSQIIQQHKNKQNTKTFAFTAFIANKSTNYSIHQIIIISLRGHFLFPTAAWLLEFSWTVAS